MEESEYQSYHSGRYRIYDDDKMSQYRKRNEKRKKLFQCFQRPSLSILCSDFIQDSLRLFSFSNQIICFEGKIPFERGENTYSEKGISNFMF